MIRAGNDAVRQRQRSGLVSVLPAVRAGGAALSAVEQQLVEDFRQMSASSRDVMVRFFDKQASRDRSDRIAATKPMFHVLKGGGA